MITTVQQHILLQQEEISEASGKFSWLLSGITLATKMVEAKIRLGGLSDAARRHGRMNVQGEQQQKLDVYANQALLHCLGLRDSVAALISEEDEQPVTFNLLRRRGKYIIVFDPLDGSSNIDVNVNVGTIFSVLRAYGGPQTATWRPPSCSRGTSRWPRGTWCMGPRPCWSTPRGRECMGSHWTRPSAPIVLSAEYMRMPEQGKYYSVNEANAEEWPQEYRDYIDRLRPARSAASTVRATLAASSRTSTAPC